MLLAIDDEQTNRGEVRVIHPGIHREDEAFVRRVEKAVDGTEVLQRPFFLVRMKHSQSMFVQVDPADRDIDVLKSVRGAIDREHGGSGKSSSESTRLLRRDRALAEGGTAYCSSKTRNGDAA